MSPQPPRPHQSVTVSVPGIGQLPARVETAGGGSISLVLLVDPPRPLGDVEALLEWPTARGLVRLPGELHGGTVLEPRGEPEVLQRREFVRVDVVRPVELVCEVGPIDTYTLDLSAGGLRVAGPAALRTGEALSFRLRLGDWRPAEIDGRARVVRHTPEGHRGLAIERIEPSARETIVRYVLNLQRIARSRTRDG